VVLTPRRWRESDFTGDGGNKALDFTTILPLKNSVAQGRPGVPVNLW
jgi:hypothetical protein